VLLQVPPGPAAAPAPPSHPSAAITNPLVETSLMQKQKLDCALQLARSVALDFNNALTIILGHTSLLLSRLAAEDPMRHSLIEMERSAERAAEIAADLAAFSRQEKEGKTHAAGNLNVIVRQTCELFHTRCGPEIAWKLELEPKLFATHVDEAKMQQALVRVIENATESLAHGTGSVTLISRNVEVAEQSPETSVRLMPGYYVCVEVRDTGCGISEPTLGRIFEPFFTTKTGHRGLGLAWVYGIITNHGGTVAVSSEPAVGTSLRIYLPATRRLLPDGGARATDLAGKETILIVDDEELILTLGETVLSAFGYRVLTATSGARALQILREATSPVELVITDMVMPGMSGRELTEKIRPLSPTTRILCSSGYVRPPQSDDNLYLQKPFTSQQLLVKVRQALDT
jgi:two-component system, cell cycle sensor histidine kinase and response regulator CckA